MAIGTTRSVAPEAAPRTGGNVTRDRGVVPDHRASALLVAAAVLAAVLIVDPMREFMSQDDGWAYARSVEYLLRTGEYRLDAWSAANMPVQIYLAAGLAKVFGYSFSLLRISTLLLLVGGLAALYGLLRRGLPAWPAAALTLGLLASPLVLMLGFTFMSDIQFMSWLLIAMWLYVRGFEAHSDAVVALGSLAAACAIGTRQFGMAVIAGLIVTWFLSRPTTRPPLRRMLWALALPVAVSAWQLQAALAEPNFTQAVRLHEQTQFLTRSLPAMAHELGWRMSTLMQYVGLSLLPVLPLLVSQCWGRARPPAGIETAAAAHGRAVTSLGWRSPRLTILLALATLLGLLLFSLTSSAVSTRENAGRVLPLPWMLPTAFWSYTWLMRGFAAAGVLGAFCLLLLFWGWQGHRPEWRRSWSALLLGSTGIVLVALHLSYVQLNDTYVVGLLPFTILSIGAALAQRPPAAWVLRLTATWAIAMLVLLSAWMRGDYNRQQVQWAAADRLAASGVPPRCIGATRHWSEYRGAFDDWLAATHPEFDHRHRDRSPAPPGPLHRPFYAWMDTRSSAATYQVTSGSDEPVEAGWRVIAQIPYHSASFAVRSVQVLQRRTPQPPGAKPCPPPAVLP